MKCDYYFLTRTKLQRRKEKKKQRKKEIKLSAFCVVVVVVVAAAADDVVRAPARRGEKITMYDKDQDWFVAHLFSATHAKKPIIQISVNKNITKRRLLGPLVHT